MDLTTLTYVLLLAVGYLGFDAAIHPPDAILETEAIGTFDKTTITAAFVDDVLTQEVQRIESTPTLMTRPRIRIGRLQGLAMSLAEALKMQAVAYALQAELGYRPDQIKITLYGEGGTAKVLVSGTGQQRMTSFQQQLTLEPGETIVELLQRAAVVGMAHIDPYVTALNQIQSHADDKHFAVAQTIIDYALARLPPTPLNFERALFENLNGLIALFNGDANAAHTWFVRAEASCPDHTPADAVVSLNGAFAEIQLDQDRDAVERMQRLLRDKPPTDKVVLSTTYMTLAAAQMGVSEVDAADRSLAKAIDIYPEASSAYDLWADIKRDRGDEAEAERLHRKAMENSAQFENYGEIAALYFRLAWRENQPVMRSPFSNPTLGGVHTQGHRSQSDSPAPPPVALQ
jgi:tetratricopeptide (TPR) repeat protein